MKVVDGVKQSGDDRKIKQTMKRSGLPTPTAPAAKIGARVEATVAENASATTSGGVT
jgi:hypothetical protein